MNDESPTPDDSIADRNIERLLEAAYRPESPDPAFVQRLLGRIGKESAQLAGNAAPPPLFFVPARLLVLAAAAAVLIVLGVLLSPRSQRPTEEQHARTRLPAEPPSREGERLPADFLIAAAAPAAAAIPELGIGGAIRTGLGQRREVRLPNGADLFINQQTEVTLESSRQLKLSRGEIFLQTPRVGPSAQTIQPAPLMVETRDRRIVAHETRFDVRAEPQGTRVTVTQGSVAVSGLDQPVAAGQEVMPGSNEIAAAPRLSHVLDWMRDLLAAGTPLIPASRYSGGALVAQSREGGETNLDLRKYHIDVHIEDGFARTTIDQTYFNAEVWRTEGTFYFPLPTDASLSRLAMYVDGRLMEGGMAERQFARDVYESIVRRQKDPALLEWVDGRTFKMRVFPLEPRQEKRIILSYTQRLPSLYGRMTYRFPSGHDADSVRKWSVHVRVKGGATLGWNSGTQVFTAGRDGDDLVLDSQARNTRPEGDVVLTLEEPAAAQDAVRFSSMVQDGWRYLMLRYRPALHARAGGINPLSGVAHRDWIFLMESSASRGPLLARAQIEIIRGLLANAGPDDRFAVLSAGTSTHVFADHLLPVTDDTVHAALDFLGRAHLIGSLDLSHALNAAMPLLQSARHPYLVHLGSGVPELGVRRVDALCHRLPAGVRYVGVAVGGGEPSAFMQAAATATAGYTTQIDPAEPLAWRALDLAATLDAPRLQRVQVTDPSGKASFLAMSSAVSQGEELCAITRLPAATPVPPTLRITATLNSQPFEQMLTVKNVSPNAAYLPRTWARLEIGRLLKENAEENHDEIVALSKAMYVMTPFTSLLVLENEAMYQEFKVDRGRKDHWAMYACPERIPPVHEPIPEPPMTWERYAQEAQSTVHTHRSPPVLSWGPSPNERRVRGIAAMGGYGLVNDPRLKPPSSDSGDDDVDVDTGAWQAGWPARAALDLPMPQAPVPGFGNGGLIGVGGLGSFGVVKGGLGALGGVGGVGGLGGLGALGGALGGGLGALGGSFGAGASPMTGPRHEPGALDIQEELAQAVGENFEINGARPGVKRTPVPVRPGHHLETGTAARAHRLWAVREKLAQSITIDFPAGTTVGTALGLLSKRSQLTILINREAFTHDPDTSELFPEGIANEAVNLPPLRNMSLAAVLRHVVAPVQGVPLIRDGYVEIVSAAHLRRLREQAAQSLTAPITLWNADFRVPRDIRSDGEEEDLPTDGAGANSAVHVASCSIGWGVPDDPNAVHPVTLPSALALMPDSRSGRERWMSDGRPWSWMRENLPEGWWSTSAASDAVAGTDQIELRRPAKFPDGHAFLASLMDPLRSDPTFWLYERPKPLEELPSVSDLLSFVPGLDTNRADVQALFDNEWKNDPRVRRGRIDPGARRLIDAARAAGWQTVQVPVGSLADSDREQQARFTITFDGRGRFVYERTLLGELRERAVCDGVHLWHLYPDLGLAGRRTMSASYRRTFSRLVPWALPEVEDLAQRADVRLLDPRTVAVTPHNDPGADTNELHLLFDGTGRLAERRLVERHSQRILYRETYGADGMVQLLDGDGSVLAAISLRARAAQAPPLAVDTHDLVVLPLPVRSSAYILQRLVERRVVVDNAEPDYAKLPREDAVALLAAYCSEDLNKARAIFQQRFAARGDRPVGFYLLLMWSGFDVANLPKPTSPDRPAPLLMRRLAMLRELKIPVPGPWPAANIRAALHDLETGGQDHVAWAALGLLHDRAPDSATRQEVAKAYKLFEDVPGLHYAASYEYARGLLDHGQSSEAAKLFLVLYAETLDQGALPRIDRSFVAATAGHGAEPDHWTALMRQTTARLIAEGHREAAVTLAWQCYQLEQAVLSAELLKTALEGPMTAAQRWNVTRYAASFLWHTGQLRRAQEIIAPLEDDPAFASQDTLWRLGALLAMRLRERSRFLRCLEHAVDLEFQHLPKTLDMVAVRIDLGLLLSGYYDLAESITLGVSPPSDLEARVIRTTDRWRLLEPDDPTPCPLAAAILYRIGAKSLAWDYLNTPHALFPPDVGQWLTLATMLAQQEDFELADRAYEQAEAADPDDADIPWRRAQNLERLGSRH